jgi:signal transduction histidine kinase
MQQPRDYSPHAADRCPLARPLAERLRHSRGELTTRWLERIVARVSVERNRVFPSNDLLDHVPLLIDGIAAYVENPAEEIAADVPVVAKAMELGELRYSQGFDAYEIFKEYELLGGVLFSFLATVVDEIDEPCTRAELLRCAHRVFHAVGIIQQVTTMHFLRRTGEQIREREGRLRAFNRMVSHELKNRIGAVQGAHSLLRETWVDDAQRERFLSMIGENVHGMHAVLEDLMALSRLETSARQQQNIVLPRAAAEVVRQLRRHARSRGVTVRIAPNLPAVEVNAAAVELCLTNYVSNAIKYSDPNKVDRWVEIRARVEPGPADGSPTELVTEVWDNGLGVPTGAQGKLFERFFRAHEVAASDVEGTGLGLSIVRETVETLGGRAWLQPNPDGGSVFAFAVPCRRSGDGTRLRESVVPAPGADKAVTRPG